MLNLLGVEIIGDQKFCSYPDYNCSAWCSYVFVKNKWLYRIVMITPTQQPLTMLWPEDWNQQKPMRNF